MWPKEGHTTGGQWLIPWLNPDTVFRLMRRKPQFQSFNDVDFYRSGIIGSTYMQILDHLDRPEECVELSLAQRNYLRRAYAHAVQKSPLKTLTVNALNMFEPIARTVLRRPMTVFMPFLNHLVFQKRA